jgi:hypothetical protein
LVARSVLRRWLEILEGGRLEMRIFQQGQGGFEDGVLQLGIVGSTERVSVFERDHKGAGWANFFRHHPEQLKGDSGNALTFQFRSDQAHGLVAHRSDRNQQGRVNLIIDKGAGGCGSGVACEAARSGNRSHEREMPMVKLTDATGLNQFAEPVDGESEVRILVKSIMAEGFAPMKFTEIGNVHIGRDFAEAGIASAEVFIEGELVRQGKSGA